MFDYVKVEDEKLKGDNFQTKSLYNCLEQYLISDKQLFLYRRDKEKFYEINWFCGKMFLNQLDENGQLLWFTLEFEEGKLLKVLEGFVEEEN